MSGVRRLGVPLRQSSGWICGNGAKWDLTKKSTGQRPDGWTSADAAGLSIYAGLARYEEVMAGEITHALRFTLPCTSDAASRPRPTGRSGGCAGRQHAPPMGVRVRLKASYDISGFAPIAQKFLRAFKKHGLILADNGGSSSTFYFQSEDNPNWPDEINDLKDVPVSAFEAVSPERAARYGAAGGGRAALSLLSLSASSIGGRSSRFGTSVISMRRFLALFSGVSLPATGD